MTLKEFNWDRKISLKEIAQFYEDRIREADSSLSRIKEEMIGLEKRIKEAEGELQKGASERKRLQQVYLDLPNAFREEFSRIYDIIGLFLGIPSAEDIEAYYIRSHGSKSWEEVFSTFMSSITLDKNEHEEMKPVPTAYPPCIGEYLSQGTDGVTLPNWAFVTLSNFLLRIGHSEKQVVEIIRDFEGVDQGLFWYLSEISRFRLTAPVPPCALLEKLHLCYKGDDPICPRIKDYGTPITYYKKKLRLKER